MAWNFKDRSNKHTRQFRTFALLALGFLVVFALLNINYVIHTSSTKPKKETLLTEERMKQIQNDQISRIKDLLFPPRRQGTIS